MIRDFFKRLFGMKQKEQVQQNSEPVIQTVILSDVQPEPVAAPPAPKKKRAQKPKKVVETAWPFDEPALSAPAKMTARKKVLDSKTVSKSTPTPITTGNKKRSSKKTDAVIQPVQTVKKKSVRTKKNV